MAESFVQVNVNSSSGKKLKTFESIDGGGNVVHCEAVTVVDADGVEVTPLTDAQLRAAPVAVAGAVTQRRFDIQALVIYIGTAALGVAESSASWRIKRVSLDGAGLPTAIQWSASNVVWNDRVSVTYT